MTKTINDTCGKCGAEKILDPLKNEETKVMGELLEDWEKRFYEWMDSGQSYMRPQDFVPKWHNGRLKQFIVAELTLTKATAEREGYDKGHYDGRNSYYFDSPEYLTDEAHRLACTIAQRWNQDNYNNTQESFIKEMTGLSNKLVSITKQIINAKPPHQDKENNEKSTFTEGVEKTLTALTRVLHARKISVPDISSLVEDVEIELKN